MNFVNRVGDILMNQTLYKLGGPFQMLIWLNEEDS